MSRYRVVLADPAWRFSNAQNGNADNHYPTVRLEEIAALPVADICADDAALFLWCPSALLFAGGYVLRHWGFRFVTVGFVWYKRTKDGRPRMVMGRHTRPGTELCLLGVRGSPKRANAGIRQEIETWIDDHPIAIEAPIVRHSAKPVEQYERIEELYGDVPRVELFARNARDGWDCWGNEVAVSAELAAFAAC